MDLNNCQVWQCSIYVPKSNKLPNGADFAPRMAVIDKLESCGFDVVACASGWGGGVLKVKFDSEYLVESLYKEIEHGDEEHRKWLKDKLYSYFEAIKKEPNNVK